MRKGNKERITMKELKHIKHEVCPYCGASWETYSGEGILDGEGEYIHFECGLRLSFMTETQEIEESRDCYVEQERRWKTTQAKRKVAAQKVEAFIKDLDVDDDFKEEVNKRAKFTWDTSDVEKGLED